MIKPAVKVVDVSNCPRTNETALFRRQCSTYYTAAMNSFFYDFIFIINWLDSTKTCIKCRLIVQLSIVYSGQKVNVDGI